MIGNLLAIHNRMGFGAGRKANSTILTLQSARRDCERWKRWNFSNLQGARVVNLLGKVWMGRLQYVGAYLAPSWSMIDTSKVQGDVHWRHLVVGDHNAAQAGIAANEKTDIGALNL